MKYFLSLGSNINAEKNLEFALEELNKLLSNVESSSIHQTKAEGFEGDDFLNSVVCGNSELEFNCLLYTSPSPRDNRVSRMPSSA